MVVHRIEMLINYGELNRGNSIKAMEETEENYNITTIFIYGNFVGNVLKYLCFFCNNDSADIY